MSQVIDLRERARGSGTAAQRTRTRFAAARRSTGLSAAAFAARLEKEVGWSVLAETVTSWETTGVPPGDVLVAAEDVAGQTISGEADMHLITDYRQLKAAMAGVVTGARTDLAVTGSRSRDADYLALIEQQVAQHPGVVHHRVLYGPPRHGAMKQHLLRLVDLQRPAGSLFVGIVPDVLRDPERFICSSESEAVLILPSLTSTTNFDTGIHFTDPDVAAGFLDHVHNAYLGADPIRTREQVLAMDVVR